MQTWIVDIMNHFGYVGIALLIAIENLFPPIPSEVILTFGGFMTTYSSLTIPGVIIASTFGSVSGAIVLYWVGRIFSVDTLGNILDGKIGKALHFRKSDFLKACEWFNSKGKYTVLFCRCIPVIRSLISIPAGVSKMELSSFIIMTIVGSFVWNTVLVCLGAFAGSSWSKIVEGSEMYKTVVLIILGVALVLTIGVYFKKKINTDKKIRSN